MSMTSSPAHPQSAPRGTALRNFLIGALFALVLLIPKLLHVRRNTHSWLLFRILLGAMGSAFVVLPLGTANSYVLSLVGLAMFIGAILLPPARPRPSADDKARELGAMVVVNGGRYQPENAPATAVQLFIGSERVWVLDATFQSLLQIPVVEIAAARAEKSIGRWLLRVSWADRGAEFLYQGMFAEHLARVAESTLRSVMRPSLPVIRQSRAAGA